jgi:hypothetical protein
LALQKNEFSNAEIPCEMLILFKLLIMAEMESMKPKSITHQHILATINTLLPEVIQNGASKSIRIRDDGCGDGELLSYLLASLSLLQPSLDFEVFGLDVENLGVQELEFIEKPYVCSCQPLSLLQKFPLLQSSCPFLE